MMHSRPGRLGLAVACCVLGLSLTVAQGQEVSFDGGALKVSPDVVEGAKKEGKVVVRGSMRPKDWNKFIAPFKEKVPWLEIEYTSAPFRRRVQKTVTEFRAGRVAADIVTGIMGAIPEFSKLDMLGNISDLPTYAMYGPQLKDKHGRWIARQTLFWGVAYRTDRVKKEEIRTWDDLLKPEWGQRLATANKPHLLPHILWADWGPEKAKAWIKNFFATGLQLRKEGSGAVANLLAAGEYDVLFTVHGRAIRRLADKGSPVAWTFPEGPVYQYPSYMCAIKQGPNPNAARLLLTYWTSREGQLNQFKADGTLPVHPELLGKRQFVSWPDELSGRELAVVPIDKRLAALPATRKFWKQQWLGQ